MSAQTDGQPDGQPSGVPFPSAHGSVSTRTVLGQPPLPGDSLPRRPAVTFLPSERGNLETRSGALWGFFFPSQVFAPGHEP